MAGRRALTQKDLAEYVAVSRSTFNDWWTKATVPGDYLPLVQVAELLDGDRDEWIGRCREARDAYERLRADGRRDTRAASRTTTQSSSTPVSSVDQLESRKVLPDARSGRLPGHRAVLIVAIVAACVVAVPLGWWWYRSAHQPQAAAQPPTPAPHQITVRIPTGALPPALSSILGRGGRALPPTVTGFQVANSADDLCLSANIDGPTSGQNGDRVQLAGCSTANNEVWIPIQWDVTKDKLTWLVNYRYPTKCLNADNGHGGPADGRRVQLWGMLFGSQRVLGLRRLVQQSRSTKLPINLVPVFEQAVPGRRQVPPRCR